MHFNTSCLSCNSTAIWLAVFTVALISAFWTTTDWPSLTGAVVTRYIKQSSYYWMFDEND